MLFNSYLFFLFLTVVVSVYWCLPHQAQNRFLLVASYVFYGVWDPRFLSLIILSTLVDFFAAKGISQSGGRRSKKYWLALSLVTNLGLLAVFKYSGFFVRECGKFLELIGFQANLPVLEIVLPVGISFYTFQTLSYTIDVYRGQVKAVGNFLDFALYVSFFPQLVAGPIERSGRLMPQVTQPRKRGGDQFREGLFHILTGLFKKVVVADNMAVLANHVFATPVDELTGVACLVGVYAFAFQIYGDFSGYSSIAQGVAKWLGFDLMANFRQPYFAASPQDFWRRWHISLSTWLRDYVYVPLGGNRGSVAKTYRNLILTMVLGGLWHGANWTFLVWGVFHGAWLAIQRVLSRGGGVFGSRVGRVVKILVTFHLVCLGWLFFRADSLTHAVGMLEALVSRWGGDPFASTCSGLILFYISPWMLYEAWVERDRGRDLTALTKTHWVPRAFAYSYLVLMLLYFHSPEQNEFIYFQF